MGILNPNEILASNDNYIRTYNAPKYDTYPCKRIQQSLHHWYHWSSDIKGVYGKDHNLAWYYFYEALHNPPASEKIVSLTRTYYGTDTQQLWAFLLFACRTLK